jgi:hypothetical protein
MLRHVEEKRIYTSAMNWHNLVIFRQQQQHGLARYIPGLYNKIFLTGKPLRLWRTAPRRRGCAFLFLFFSQYFHAYQIKNWPKGGLAAFWRAAYLGSDALTRERPAKAMARRTSRQKIKKPGPTPGEKKKKRVIRFTRRGRDIISGNIRKSLCVSGRFAQRW